MRKAKLAGRSTGLRCQHKTPQVRLGETCLTCAERQLILALGGNQISASWFKARGSILALSLLTCIFASLVTAQAAGRAAAADNPIDFDAPPPPDTRAANVNDSDFSIDEAQYRVLDEYLSRTRPVGFAGMSRLQSDSFVVHLKGDPSLGWLKEAVDRADRIAHPTTATPPDPAMDQADQAKAGVLPQKGATPETLRMLRLKLRRRERFSYDELDAVRQRLRTQAVVADVVYDSIDAVNNRVAIAVSVPRSADLEGRILKKLNAGGPKIAVETNFGSRPTVTIGRTNDSPPSWAGKSIKPQSGPGSGTCTAGPVVYDLNPAAYGVRYMLTSNHCGAGSFYNDNGTGVGAMQYATTYYDSGLLAGSSYGLFTYVGSPTSTTNVRFVGATTASSPCGDGAKTGYNFGSTCGARDPYFANGQTGCWTFVTAGTICGLYRAASNTGSPVWTYGDSGGPVVVNFSSGW